MKIQILFVSVLGLMGVNGVANPPATEPVASKDVVPASITTMAQEGVLRPTQEEWWTLWDLQMASAGRYTDEKQLSSEFDSQIDSLKCLTECQKTELKKLVGDFDQAVNKNTDDNDQNPTVLKTRAAILLYRYPNSTVSYEPKVYTFRALHSSEYTVAPIGK